MSERALLDRYDTPLFAVRVLLRELRELGGKRLFDPCSGDGRMAAALAGRFEEVITNDIDPTAPTPNHHDLCKRWIWESVAPDWTVTNPPFCLVGQALNLALDYSRKGVALLVRLSVLEVCKGRERIEMMPPDRIVVLPRIKFRGKGSDLVTCAWMVWLTGQSEPSAIRTYSKRTARSLEGIAA